ncbi:MAG: helix-turn-helix domain-containing protein, partial [Acidimicrobiia bacterium]
ATASVTTGIAERIARERAVRGLTIEALASRASISSGLLSQLERGIGNPSLGTMVGIAQALDLPLSVFFEGAADDAEYVVRPNSRKRLIVSDDDVSLELLVPDLRGSLSMLFEQYPTDFSNEDAPFRHAGEEAQIVLAGRVEFHVGERVFVLDEGDSIRIAPSIPHWIRTIGGAAVIISAQTPPLW